VSTPTNRWIRFKESSKDTAEMDFDDIAAQGWTLVTCWPDGGKIHGVFQKMRVATPMPSENLPENLPRELPDGPTLADVVKRVLKTQPAKAGYPHSLSVPAFAKEHKCKGADMLPHLRHLGLKAKKDDPMGYVLNYEGKFHVFLKKWQKFYFINVQSKEDYKKSPAKNKAKRSKTETPEDSTEENDDEASETRAETLDLSTEQPPDPEE
jgi:hypothetical protein